MKKYKSAKEKFTEIIEFKEKYGKMPSYKIDKSQENAALEGSLYSWMQAMKMARKGRGTAKYPEWLDEKAKENDILKYFFVLDKAQEQFNNLLNFYQINKRKPKRYKAENKSEAKLAHWIHQMRQERRRKTDRYPEWLDEKAKENEILDWFILKDSKEDKKENSKEDSKEDSKEE